MEVAELREHDESDVGELRSLEADLSLVLALEDVEQVGADLEPAEAQPACLGERVGCVPSHRRFAVPAGS